MTPTRLTTDAIEIAPEVARNVLWYFGDREHGWRPGGFTTTLLDAIGKADSANQERLALGYPEHVRAMKLAMYTDTGMEFLAKGLEK